MGHASRGGVGVAAVRFQGGEEIMLVRLQLGMESEHMVFEAEVIGLTLTVGLLTAERGFDMAMLGTNNQEGLKAMRGTKGESRQHLVDCFHEQMDLAQQQHTSAKVRLSWTPGHAGLAGNEKVDEEAKNSKGRHQSGQPVTKVMQGMNPEEQDGRGALADEGNQEASCRPLCGVAEVSVHSRDRPHHAILLSELVAGAIRVHQGLDVGFSSCTVPTY